MKRQSGSPTRQSTMTRARRAAKLRGEGHTWAQVGALLDPPVKARRARQLAALVPPPKPKAKREMTLKEMAEIEAASHDPTRNPFKNRAEFGYIDPGMLERLNRGGSGYNVPPRELEPERVIGKSHQVFARDMIRLHSPPNHTPETVRWVESAQATEMIELGWTPV